MTLAAYKPPFLIRGAHLETLYPHFFRKVEQRSFTALIVETPDDDFLEADHYKSGHETLIMLSHGLEGNSRRDYMLGMANLFLDHNFDVLAWNYRGCGAQMNRQPRLYHSGATDDLETMVNKAIALGYTQIILIGFSLGGNLTLKYCGEKGHLIHPAIKAAIAFSTPLDLDAGCTQLTRPGNFLYSYRFLTKLKEKARRKHKQYPESLDLTGIEKIKDLRSFDDRYTAPLHGFIDAAEYYAKCSSLKFVDNISIPTLVLNAKNDPFLPEECYPFEKLAKNQLITFEVPDHGGHVGFAQRNHNGAYWSELRALEYVKKVIGSA